jgi:hypothetical protein
VKKLSLVLCFVLVWAAGGCSKKLGELLAQVQESVGNSESDDEFAFEGDAVKYDAPAVYHNSYLNFSYTVPKGWWLYELNTDNFSEDPEDTADSLGLDIYYGEDDDEGDEYIFLISFANLQYSSKDNHLGFDISAEKIHGVSDIEGYMEYFVEYMLEPEEDAVYGFISSSRVDIGGTAWEQRIFAVEKTDDGTKYNLLTLTRPAEEGYYLTITASYWPSNKKAEAAIISAVRKGL